ncbi:BrnA antitoxin family protein [Testudinibacter sp. TR-2022]|uniref:BrnA antitoxin family protein n=1 Tax=Testudinibacter sp. TR-2022 TaxID=2585029 RepID=UPI0011182A71|nr:BrnA antitoxin family protein [Testudinibacter sp. TR-2022]TNG94781.1 BrnA antitoxin family protein [Pasteurellaceae bacterium UScroc12]TNG94961.1 BrnA antitoxin family protein [Pasteurellaceae bacterium USgator41]TNH00664.1 BrnA antitoxin family protein [Pasteurellaceae bacterium UScroc31]TNH02090.1 BrnA antitoxin family protein [Pasteurellaceae bacterium USgator11]TNH04468.1 BrnA antitoxin family protein [Pasteurellaceae bacterium Phil31]
MKPEYDFSNAVKNPYAKNLKSKKVVTIRIDDESVDYFKQLSKEMNMPYQTLINLYLRDCVKTGRKPVLQW